MQKNMGDLSNSEYDPSAVYKARLMHLANRADEQLHLTEKLEATKQYAVEHPMVTMAAVVTIMLCSVPILCFGAFVLGSLFCTFMGFLFIEGFLLTVGGVILGTVLLATGILSVFLSMLLASAWLMFHFGSKIFQTATDIIQNRRQEVRNMKGEPSSVHQNGISEGIIEKEE